VVIGRTCFRCLSVIPLSTGCAVRLLGAFCSLEEAIKLGSGVSEARCVLLGVFFLIPSRSATEVVEIKFSKLCCSSSEQTLLCSCCDLCCMHACSAVPLNASHFAVDVSSWERGLTEGCCGKQSVASRRGE
jgi:hypothetical protein